METLTELKAKREALDKQIAEMEAKEWPKDNEDYYYVTCTGVESAEWVNDSIDNSIKEGLGCFRTVSEAQHYFNYFSLLREIDQFCEEKNPQGWDWREEEKVRGLFISGNKKELFNGYSKFGYAPNFGKLKEQHHAQELLEKFGDRIMEVINFKK